MDRRFACCQLRSTNATVGVVSLGALTAAPAVPAIQLSTQLQSPARSGLTPERRMTALDPDLAVQDHFAPCLLLPKAACGR